MHAVDCSCVPDADTGPGFSFLGVLYALELLFLGSWNQQNQNPEKK
jgi:hypothetical protein